MNELIDLLDLLYKKFPVDKFLVKENTLDSFRVLQGRQDVVSYIEDYITNLEQRAKKTLPINKGK